MSSSTMPPPPSSSSATASDVAPNARVLHRQLQSLNRAMASNTRLRAVHVSEPLKFAASELELHDATLALSSVAAAPSLYPAFVRAGGVSLLIDVLAHPNVDVVTAALRVLDDMSNIEGESDLSDYRALYDALFDGDAFDGVLTVLDTFVSQKDLAADVALGDTFAHGLALFENALDIHSDVAKQLGTATGVVAYCARALKMLDSSGESAEKNAREARVAVAQGAVELLALLLQDVPENRTQAVEVEVLCALVDAAAIYVGRAPRGADEAEMAQNILGVLCSALLAGEVAKRQFVDADGVELMVVFARQSRDLRAAAVKVLDFACMGCRYAVERAFDAGVVGILFAVFVQICGEDAHDGRKRGRKGKLSKEERKNATEHVLGALFSLFRYSGSESRGRLLFKFWEEEGVKMKILLQVYRTYAKAVDAIPGSKRSYLLSKGTRKNKHNQAMPKDPEESDALYLERLDAGLFIVQLSAVLLTQVLADGPAEQRQVLCESLPAFGLSKQLVREAVMEYSNSIEAADGSAATLKSRSEEQARLKGLIRAADARSRTEER